MGVLDRFERVSTGSSTAPSRAPSRPRSSRSRSPPRCSASATTGPRSSTAAARWCPTSSPSSSGRTTTSGCRRTPSRWVPSSPRWCASTRKSRVRLRRAASTSRFERGRATSTRGCSGSAATCTRRPCRRAAHQATRAPARTSYMPVSHEQRVRRHRARRPPVPPPQGLDDDRARRRLRHPDRRPGHLPGPRADRPGRPSGRGGSRLHQRHLGRRPPGPEATLHDGAALALGSTNFVVRLG